MTCSRRMPAFDSVARSTPDRPHLPSPSASHRISWRDTFGPAGVRQPAHHATGAALTIGRRHGVIEDSAGMRLEISGPQGCGIVDLLTTDMAGRTVDRGLARPGEQREAGGQPHHRPGAPLPSQPASSPPALRISAWRPPKKPSKPSSAPSSKRSDSGASGVPATPAMRRSISNASPSGAGRRSFSEQ